MSRQKRYGRSLREQIRLGTLSLEEAKIKAPYASSDTQRKWGEARYQREHRYDRS